MNIHSNKIKNKEVEDVSTRVKNTKREIEQLKNELQDLFNSGSQFGFVTNVEKTPPKSQPLAPPQLVETVRRRTPISKNVPPVPKKIEPTKSSPSKKIEPTKSSPSKKVRTYNVADAREFIKKQKERRAEELKAQIHVTENQVDLKKEKLRELHQKALELVNKNVQLKRERSKSRDREPPVRLDKSNPRHKSQENVPSKSQDRLKPPCLPVTRAKSQENVTRSRPNVPSKSQDRLKPPGDATRAKSQDRGNEKPKLQGKPTNERTSRTRTRAVETAPSRLVHKVDTNLLYPPNVKATNSGDIPEYEKTFFPFSENAEVAGPTRMLIPDKETKSSAAIRTRSKSPIMSQVPQSQYQKWDERPNTTRTKTKSKKETVSIAAAGQKVALDFINTNTTDFDRTSYVQFESRVPDLNRRIQEHDNRAQRVLPKNVTQRPEPAKQVFSDTKETQTNRNFAEPPWMQPPPALPYPYNFINTVKRKLQQAINSPRNYVDVAVQNSGSETPDVGRTKSREEIKEMLMKSTGGDLRSFASHKGPNLDLQVVENLELVPNSHNRLKSSKDGISRNLFTGYDSESDTSKNIPEISSESLASGTAKPNLNLEKLKDLKLQKVSKASHSDVQTDINGLEKDSYSSDFQKESIGSVKGKSSSIKTVVSENKGSDLVTSSETSLVSNASSGTVTNHTASSTHSSNKDGNISKRSVQHFTNFINKNLRGDGDSQRSFKSLLTDSQLSKSSSSSPLVTKSFVLKQPSVSLTVARGQRGDKVSMSTITIRSPTANTSYENRGSGDDSQRSFKSLLSQEKSGSSIESVPEMLIEDAKSASNGKDISLSLKAPTVSLKVAKEQKRNDMVKSQMKNITLKSATLPNSTINELHLKFEAEVRLLNDFNESFKQLKAVEEAFETLKNKHEMSLAMTKTLQNVDTQTSIVTKTSTNVTSERGSKNSSINFSRGSEVVGELNDSAGNNNRRSKSLQDSSFSTDWNLSNLNDSSVTNVSIGEEGRSKLSISGIENFDLKVNNCASILSLNIFDQLIKDEDTRIQQLKTIIKIREQALLDRTKSELVWLDIQKKKLIETGQLEEASLLKKKQRGIILKHEQERNEIKKLKQMQKEASEHRKNTLKQQRNLIKSQLCTDNMLSQITVKKRKERRSTGPLRVVQSCSESIHSETSISLKSSGLEDILSITSKSLRVSEESEYDLAKAAKEEDAPVSSAKRSLLMREAALQRRRKTAEELLRWHRKLLDEERKIGELEAAATSVVRREAPKDRDRHRFEGRQLNQLWRNMTGRDEKRFVEDKLYVMSQMALERLCKSARQHAAKSKKAPKHGDVTKKSADDANYSSAFEAESVQEIISQDEKTKISSISELIDNFSRIEDEISTLSRKSEDIVSLNTDKVDEVEGESEKTEAEESEESSSKDVEEETSVIEAIEQSPKEEIEEVTSLGKSVEAVSTSVEDQEATPEQRSSKQEYSEEIKSIPEVTIEEQKEQTEEILSTKSVEEISVQVESHDIKTVEQETESVKESTTPEDQASVVDEQISKNVEESKLVSTLLDDVPSEEQISTNEDTEELKSSQPEEIQKVEEVQNEKTVEQAPSEKASSKSSTSIEEDESTDEHTTISTEDQATSEDEAPSPSEKISDTDEKLIPEEEKTPTTEDKEELVEAATPSEQISAKDEKVITLEEKTPTIEEKEERLESTFEDVKELLSLEEALESASKIEESLSKLNEKLISNKEDEVSGDISSAKSIEETPSKSHTSSSVHTDVEEKTPDKKSIDVKKRVSEILADVSLSRGDKSPRLQDLYVTAYDVGATNSPEFHESYIDGRHLPPDIYGSEAEELRRKQLAIEQEIKQIELQQKEQLPYLFMREIPNKPPPPYTPPSSLSSLPHTILPSEVKEITELASYSSKVLYKAYQNNNLDKVKFSENAFKLFSKVEVSKSCAEYVFDVCRDVAKSHYEQFEKREEPTWLALAKKPQLAKTKPSDAAGLEKILTQKLKELFGFKKAQVAESAIIKWGRKKRDHVDEVLVIESQEEESQWTNFDKDELVVKSQATDDIMKMLLEETATVFAKIFAKKRNVVGRACDMSE